MTHWPQPMQPPSPHGRLIGYARVSTPDQKLDHQLDLLARVGCDKVFYDQGVSGAKAKRPGSDKLLRYLAAGDLLVVYKLDRLGRSVQHLSDLIIRFDERDIHFCSLTEGLNTATSGGKLIFHIFAAMAEFHRDLIRENTKNGLDAARKRGKRLGRPPLLNDDQTLIAHQRIYNDGATLRETAIYFEVSPMDLSRFSSVSLNWINPIKENYYGTRPHRRIQA